MLNQQVKDFLRPLDLHTHDTLINQKITDKEKTIFGYVSKKEETLLAQEIAFEIGLKHFLHLDIHSKHCMKMDIKQNQWVERITETWMKSHEHSIVEEDWEKWIRFVIQLFDIQFDEDNLYKTVFTTRLYNGLIVQCYSPFFFEHINEEAQYLFSLLPSFAPQPYTYTKPYALTKESEQLLKEAVRCRLNTLFVSSNETYLEDLSQLCFHYIPYNERIVRIEKKQKIQTNLLHQIALKANDEINAATCVKASIRMSPDRIFVDLLDEDSVFHFSQACNIGHDGSMAGLLVTSIDEVKKTFLNSVMQTYQLSLTQANKFLADAFDCIVYIDNKANQPTLSFYQYQYNETSEEAELVSLFSNEQQTVLTENFSQDVRAKINRYTEQSVEQPVKKKQVQLQTVDLDAIFAAYKKHTGFEHIDRLKPLLTPTISIMREIEKDEKIPIGASKFGGNPDLPNDVPYPFDGKVPYSFIMQLNCETLSAYDKEHIFPKSGMLYFFHKFEDGVIPLPYDFEGSKGLKEYIKTTTIFHFDGDSSTLKRTKKPKNPHIEKIKAAKIEFVSTYTLPSVYEEKDVYTALNFTETEQEEHIERFFKGLLVAPYTPFEQLFDEAYEEQAVPVHQLLGHAYPAQASPLDELMDELSERFGQTDVKTEDWLLLCQLEVDDKLNLYWAADGFMYYFIKKEDLVNRNFQNIYSIMQCG